MISDSVHKPAKRELKDISAKMSYSFHNAATHRDFCVTSARKFKLNNDFSCSDNKKNG